MLLLLFKDLSKIVNNLGLTNLLDYFNVTYRNTDLHKAI